MPRTGTDGRPAAPIFGYTLRHRREFALTNGYDPADTTVGDVGRGDAVEELFFDNPATTKAHAEWYANRLRPVFDAVKQEAGTVPVMIEGEAVFRATEWVRRESCAYFLPWNPAKDAFPVLTDLFRSGWTIPPVPKSGIAVVAGNRETALLTAALISRLKRDAKPEATVLDLTYRNRPRVADLLKQLRGTASVR